MEYENKILQGDAMAMLKQLPDESINCVMTSPPYWALRDYGSSVEIIWDGKENCEHEWNSKERKLHSGTTKSIISGDDSGHLNEASTIDHFCFKCGAWKGQLGLEPTFDLYIKHLCDIFDEVKKVLRKDGTCWVNLGDTYNAHSTGNGNVGGMEKNNKLIQDIQTGNNRKIDLPDKSLCLIPFRFAIEMQNRGWILRNVIIWHKPNCMPSSVKDRFTVDFEYVFFFVKNKKYWFETQYERLAESSFNDDRKDKGLVPHKSGKSFDELLFNKNIKEKRLVPYSVQPRDKEFVEYRNLPDIKSFAEWLNIHRKNLGLTIEQIEKEFGNQAPHHWFNAESFPSVEDYKKLKIILDLANDYDYDMTKIYTKSSEKKYAIMGTSINSCGRNKRAVWSICPQPFPEAHFATYPEELCETPIKAGCPEFVCNKCGKAREKILESKGTGLDYSNNSNYKREIPKDNPSAKFNRNSNLKLNAEYEFKGYSSCDCNVGFSSGIVLDPFFGAGTTGLVALKQNKQFIGIELNPEYIKIAEERLKPYLEQTKLFEYKKC